jgi:hypothetical protein
MKCKICGKKTKIFNPCQKCNTVDLLSTSFTDQFLSHGAQATHENLEKRYGKNMADKIVHNLIKEYP